MSIFGSIFKGITGAVGGFLTGGPAGAIGGAAKGLGIIGKPTPATPARPMLAPSVNVGTFPVLQRAGPGGAQYPDSTVSRGGLTIQGPFGTGLQAGGGSTSYYPAVPAAPGGGKACPVGFHWNRTAYYTQRGLVGKGTKCVKNRRRNPLNARALSRSMSRITSAKKAAHFLDRIHFGPPHRAKARK